MRPHVALQGPHGNAALALPGKRRVDFSITTTTYALARRSARSDGLPALLER
jgi:hypothetical protein